MKFQIRPQLNKITFYSIAPYIIFQFTYLYINPFNHDENFINAIYFLAIIGVVLMAFMSLFKPWMLSLNADENIIRQATDFGGEIVIDIHQLDKGLSVYDEEGLKLVTTQGAILLLENHLFKKSDLLKLIAYIELMSDDGINF